MFTGSVTWLRTFGAVVWEHYDLDPAHYMGLPTLAWDAMLKFTYEMTLNQGGIHSDVYTLQGVEKLHAEGE
jgi:hypothetical protein